MLSPPLLGLLLGLAFGIASLLALEQIGKQIVAGNVGAGDQSLEKRKRTAALLRVVGWADIIFFGVVGFFVGPSLFGQFAT